MNPELLSLTTAWEKDLFGPVVGPALTREGNLYLADHLNQLKCFSRSGEPLWARELQAPAVSLAANPETDGVAVLTKPGRLLAFSAEGSLQWSVEVFAEPASLDARPDGRGWLVASRSGLCREYLADGAPGAAYHFQFALLAAGYLGGESWAAVNSTGRLVLLHRASGRFQVFPLNHYVAGLATNRPGTLLALPGYKEGVFLVKPSENRLDTCELDRNIMAATLCPTGDYLLAGAGDGLVALVKDGQNVLFSRKFNQAVTGLALGQEAAFAAAATAEGRVYLLQSAAGRRDRYAFLDGTPSFPDLVPQLSPRWSLRLFAAERRSAGARRVWRPAGEKFILTLDECQVLRVLELNGRIKLKRDFLGDSLRLAFNPCGRLVLVGDEYQLVALSLPDRALCPLPSPAQTFSASDQGQLALLGRDNQDLELYFLAASPSLIWKYRSAPAFLDLCLAASGERWFGLFQDGWLRCLDLDRKLLWAKPVFAVPELSPAPASPPAPGAYRLKPWAQNLLLISERAVTAYGPTGKQLWCVRTREPLNQAEPLGPGVLIQEAGNTYQLIGPEGTTRFTERPKTGKAFFFLDTKSNPAFVIMEGTNLTCRVAGQEVWRYQAPALVEDLAPGAEGAAVIAGEELLWLDFTSATRKSSRFDYLDL